MRRIVGSLMALALIFATGCSDSEDAAGEGAVVQARSLPAIWADVLVQRDHVQAATSKGTDMWHEDCAAVSAATAKLDELAVEMLQRVGVMPSVADRRLGIQNLIGNYQGLLAKMRSDAIDEMVGTMPTLMISLDSFLRGIEGHFTPEEIGSESVASRPGFKTIQPPPPPSPI